jgi:hypothetical protein
MNIVTKLALWLHWCSQRAQCLRKKNCALEQPAEVVRITQWVKRLATW